MNKTKKMMAVLLSLTLCTGLISTSIYAQKTGDTQTDPPAGSTETEMADASDATSSDSEVSKDETVYVLTEADGSVRKVIVSDWLKNASALDQISDISDLEQIENVKGDETFTLSGQNEALWDARGNDIYYQGTTTKELPVDIAVSYELDGNTISARDLAGKSGQVTIRFDYTNRQSETVQVDGKDETIYVPFAVLTGTVLDNDIFRNVEVSNGKLINDGDHTTVIGLALPGLQNNLALSKETIDLPDYFEIRADVTNFRLGTTMTIASNEVFCDLDDEKLESADDLESSMNQLTTAMDQLLDGASSLSDGLDTLLEKSGTLADGIEQVASGASALKSGASDLNSGVSQLKSGSSQLSSGLNQLSGNNKTLTAGAKQVFNSLLSTANKQLSEAGLTVSTLTIDNYARVLDQTISSLDKNAVYNQALAQVTAAVEAKRPDIENAVTDAVRSQVTAQVTATVQEQVTKKVTAAVKEQVAGQVIQTAAGMSKEEYDAAVEAGLVDETTQKAVEQAIAEQMKSDEVQKTIENNVAAQMDTDEIKATIASNTDTQMQTEAIRKTIAENVENQVKKAISENMASDEVQSKLAAASEGAKSIISLKASLDAYNGFYLGLLTYTDGVASAASGAAQLNAGISELSTGAAKLNAGAAELYDGTIQLKNGTPALIDGITQLRDGSVQLSDGLNQFNEEGIQKLVSALDGDLDGVISRLKATIQVSENYNNFSGIREDMPGQVKFIYRTDEIVAK